MVMQKAMVCLVRDVITSQGAVGLSGQVKLMRREMTAVTGLLEMQI